MADRGLGWDAEYGQDGRIDVDDLAVAIDQGDHVGEALGHIAELGLAFPQGGDVRLFGAPLHPAPDQHTQAGASHADRPYQEPFGPVDAVQLVG